MHDFAAADDREPGVGSGAGRGQEQPAGIAGEHDEQQAVPVCQSRERITQAVPTSDGAKRSDVSSAQRRARLRITMNAAKRTRRMMTIQ
jgi:hypothetical protein